MSVERVELNLFISYCRHSNVDICVAMNMTMCLFKYTNDQK